MSTVSKSIADRIIAGEFDTDQPLITEIIQYNNIFDGGLAYKLIYDGQNYKAYLHVPSMLNPRLYWQRPGYGHAMTIVNWSM